MMKRSGHIFLMLIAATFVIPAQTQPRFLLTIISTEDYPGTYGSGKIKYEKITGQITGEVDPDDPHNKIITDIQLADRNSRGMVEYTSDFFIIKPRQMSQSNGILRYDAPNRGNAFGARPDSLLMARGYVFLTAAWQADVAKVENNNMPASMPKMYLQVPVAHYPDGSSVTGLIRVEFAPAAGTHPSEMSLSGNVYNSGHIPYTPGGDVCNEGYLLTRRIRENDPRRFIPNSEWLFSSTSKENPYPGTPDPTKISINGGFDSDYLYELIYTGKDPKVMGVGLAAIRDIVTFFKTQPADANGFRNPVFGSIKYTLGTGTSQSGNFMKTFIHLGFNEDLTGKKVFDAIFPIVAARQTNINMRFAVPGGGGGPRTEHRAYGQASVRAFSPEYYDDITEREGGIFTRAALSNTIPKVFLLYTSSEMWSLQCSPVLTDAYGQYDLKQPDELRIYYIAGAQHSVGLYGAVNWNPERSVYPGSSMVDGNPVMRALWIDLEQWVVNGTEPPESSVPAIRNKTLVFPDELKFPVMKGLSWTVNGNKVPIPEFKYRGIISGLSLLDFGPEFNEYDESGITTVLPPAYLGKDYAIMVSQIDEDGNETGGIRTPELSVPLGTSMGFNYDARTYLEDLYGLNGSFIPFHRTKAERIQAGDTRLSLEERYGSREVYISEIEKAVNELIVQRLLLPEDGKKILQKAKNQTIF